MKPKPIKISQYPYGRINKRLRDAVKWLNKNRNKIVKSTGYPYGDYFDYPDYWNMPKKLSSRLDGDEVDFIQDQTYYWHEGK